MDFGEVKAALKKLCKKWDERFLCPVLSTHMDITAWPVDEKEGGPATISASELLTSSIAAAASSPEEAAKLVANHQIGMRVKHDGSKFVFPAADCALLPVHHSSAEELSRLLCLDLVDAMGGAGALRGRGMRSIKVALIETPRQEARYCLSLVDA